MERFARNAITNKRAPFVAELLALLLAMAFCTAPAFGLPPVEPTFYGLCYSPFRDGQSPDRGIHPSREEIAADLQLLRPFTDRLRLYGLSGSGRVVVEEASRLGFSEILAGIWIGADPAENAREIAHARKIAQMRPVGLSAFIVGSEVLLRRELDIDTLISYLAQVRKATGYPVAYADIWPVWAQSSPATDRLAAAADFVIVHIYPFWDGVSIENAGEAYDQALATVRARHPNTRFVVGETGWPAGGEPVGEAIPSEHNQARWVAETRKRQAEMPIYYFQAISEKWKIRHEGARGATWGVFTSDRKPQPAIFCTDCAGSSEAEKNFSTLGH